MNCFKKLYLLITIGLTSTAKANAQTEVTFFTTMGKFKIELTDSKTPRTVDSFLARVHDKFYDGLTFHRVIDNFMIQGGDPAGNGTGGPGYTFPDEFDATLKNVPKALAMANAGPNTNGSQFFINLVTNSHLNNKHTVFGMVTDNFAVVQAIGKVPKDANDKPTTPVIIDSIRITKFPTDVAQVERSFSVSVYPNPGKGLFIVKLPAIESKIEIVNMAGQIVFTTTSKGLTNIDLMGKPAGIYTLLIENAEGKAEEKIVIE
ncbi:MAG: T9SS type A sorting domain-containing protein [Sphingobacteriales bacterium]|nr:MAG: T9SS type A sorting domain-containing protein [Sphingobacteriales bacterium]